MTRSEIIEALRPYFNVSELVCSHTYKKWGEKSWQFLDTNLLWCLLIIRRDILKVPMVVNNASHKQRGLRCNMCSVVREKKDVYLSSHLFGKAIDAIPSGMTAKQARELIKANADLLPCNIRIEKDVTWLHFDVLPQWDITDKVYEFKG